MKMKDLILTMMIMMVSMSVFAAGSSLDEIVSKIKNGDLSLNQAMESGQISFDEALENGLVNEEMKQSGGSAGMFQMGQNADELSGYKQMPEFKAETLEGRELTQEYFKQNKLTMVNIWGTFCSPCIAEMKSLDNLNSKFKDKGFAILGICSDGNESPDLAKMIIRKKGVKFENISANKDLNNTILKNVMGVPLSFFVDSEGNIVGQQILGAMSEADYESVIEEMLKNIG